jgi:4'-phosphopantetheinyl transferase
MRPCGGRRDSEKTNVWRKSGGLFFLTGLYQQWPSPPPDLALAGDAVHVWRAELEQPEERVRQLAQTLSQDEQDRAGRFYFERHRRRFIVARAMLRAILGRYLGLDPGQLEFRYGSRGKPYLAARFSQLEFNLAHSRELALYAFTQGREIGIDLEHLRSIADIEQISARFFSARENATLSAFPENQRLRAFYNCWTRKEAYLKATGEGLTHPLDQFDVSLAPGEPARLLRVQGDPLEAARWSLQALEPASDYIAAIALRSRGWSLACWNKKV